MGFEELVDTLIADGHKSISLVSNKRCTDDENVFVEEYLILNESGDIVARKIRTPERHGWSMVDWSGRRSGNDIEVQIRKIDLNDGAAAKAYFLLLAYD